MLVVKCDRCGAYKQNDSDNTYSVMISSSHGASQNVDLCENCAQKIVNYISGTGAGQDE